MRLKPIDEPRVYVQIWSRKKKKNKYFSCHTVYDSKAKMVDEVVYKALVKASKTRRGNK